MYSSLVEAGGVELTDSEIEEKMRLPSHRHIVLVRNPYSRLASFFSDKLRTNLRRNEGEWSCEAGEWQFCQRIMFRLAKVNQDDPFNIIRDALLDITFESFVEYLPKIVWENHLVPQVNVLYIAQEYIGNICEKYKMESNIDEFWKIIGIKNPPHANKSFECPDVYQLSAHHLEIINEIYKHDFIYFGYEMLDNKA
jgi:hypothetical protein